MTNSHGLDESLLRDVHGRLTAFVARRVDNPADVGDIVQTVFLRLHERGASVAGDGRLVAWLFQVTRNAIADYYRAPSRRREVGLPSTDAENPGGDGPADPVSTASVSFGGDAEARAELASCVRPMVEGLPSPYREALTLVELQGVTQVEAAERLGVSVSGMKSRVQRGRARLRDALLTCCAVTQSASGGVLEFELRRNSACAGGSCGSAAGDRSVVALQPRCGEGGEPSQQLGRVTGSAPATASAGRSVKNSRASRA